MSDEFTTNENGSKTPEKTNFQDYTAPENEIVQNETSQMTQEQPETSNGATSAEENPQPDNTVYAYGQTAYQQSYQSEQSQPNAYQQAYYGQTQAKGTGTGFGIASLALGILSVFTFACCINYILAVLAIIFGFEQMVKNEKKGLAIGGIITAVISIVLGIAVSLYAVNIAEKMQDPDSPFYQYFEEYEQKLEEGKSSFQPGVIKRRTCFTGSPLFVYRCLCSGILRRRSPQSDNGRAILPEGIPDSMAAGRW